jgi:hypothetical protein
LALVLLLCVLLGRASDAARREMRRRIMELRNYGVAKIIRRRHRLVTRRKELATSKIGHTRLITH